MKNEKALDRIMISELRSIPIRYKNLHTNLKGKAWYDDLRTRLSKINIIETNILKEPFIPCDSLGLLGSDYYYSIAQNKSLGSPEIQHKVQSLTNRRIWLRESIANDLRIIDLALHKNGYSLYLMSGYRSPELQRLIRHFSTIEKDKDFTDKMLSDPEIYLPHATGGAFDIELMNITTGKLIPTKIPGHFDRLYLESLSNPGSFEREVRDNRRLIHNLLTTDVILPPNRVFIPQPFEYWHYGRNEKLSSVFALIEGQSHPSYYPEVDYQHVFK